ncbi:YutD-like domain-containing protein [Paenibacillus thermoaerophilus]|uniref:YutD-like domain-containing protein n=1 Tax=Paenibacillus thermoaerophilus TaxID=1215385 RepID=A0ABW2V5B8_9BACL|nr:YutD-like domain-containing protein [Paenibacillus thermoaerophilus]
MKAEGRKFYVVGNKVYELVGEHKSGFNYEAFRDRYSEVLDRYDYIVGDWGYNMLRLKGFFRENHPKANKETSIALLQDYLNEYCNFGCAYFVLEKVNGRPEGEYIGGEPQEGSAPVGISLGGSAADEENAAPVAGIKGVGTLMKGDLPMRYNRTGIPARISVSLAERKERAAARAENAAAARLAKSDGAPATTGPSGGGERRSGEGGGRSGGNNGERAERTERGGDRPDRQQPNRDPNRERGGKPGQVSNGGYGRPFGERSSGGARSQERAERPPGGPQASRPPRKERAQNGGASGRGPREGGSPRSQAPASGARHERPGGAAGGRERWNGPRVSRDGVHQRAGSQPRGNSLPDGGGTN